MTEESQVAEEVVLEREGSIAILRLGAADEKIVVLTEERIASLEKALQEIKQDRAITGLIFIGANPKGFCAGADVNAIRDVSSAKLGQELARRGQQVFDLIADLPFRTVAAIAGPCVGGGCEMVLACDYRVMLDSPQGKIGLPEIKLGILPGFGGTQRLPRLIGLREALKIILQGRVLPSARAAAVGLVDSLVSAEKTEDASMSALFRRAKSIALGENLPSRKSPSIIDRLLASNPLGRSFVRKQTRAVLQKETKGKYPAPLRALDVTLYGLEHGLEPGLKEEAKALGELIVTPECKSLVHIYFLTESAGKLGRSAKDEIEDAVIGVIGAGVMGSGIAASFLAKGFPVALVEPVAAVREQARGRIEKSLSRRRSLKESDRKRYLSQLVLTESFEELKDCSLVVEAVVENLDVKKEVFQKVAGVVSSRAILASNTSSLSITDIAEGIEYPERLIGLHFFNPVEKMPLVEVVITEDTADRAIACASALTSKLGKYPVVVANVNGFLVNRILFPYLAESAFLLSEGCSVKAIDKAAVNFGMPMGPLRLLDEVGIDVAASITEIMMEAYGERMSPPKYAKALAEAGKYGKKTGEGFYVHSGGDSHPNPELHSLLGISPIASDIAQEEIQERLILSMFNEAVRCLDEEVAGVPGLEAVGQVDLATVMGLGFAPFRGGLLHYGDTLGIKQIEQKLSKLAEKYGERFLPCEGIRLRAEQGLNSSGHPAN